jgi:hypothetical protein
MLKTFPFFSASPASPRATLSLRMAVSGVVCGLLTSAIVLAQDTKPAPPPAQPTLKAFMKKVDTRDVKKVEVKAKATPVKGVGRKQAVFDVNVNMNPMIQQFEQQGRPIVRGELLFVRHICNLTPEQLRPISRETDQTLKDVAKKIVDDQQNGRLIRMRGQGSTTPDPGLQLQEGLALVIKKHLTPDQYARYRSEFDKRSANRKQAALSFLVDSLDRELVLSSQQREKVAESLSSHWDDGWCMYMEYILLGNQFYPHSLDQYVTPLLNDNQKKVWQGVQKIGGFFGGFGNMMGGMLNDGDLLLRELGLEENAEPNPAERVKELRLNGGILRLNGDMMKVQMKKIEVKKEAVSKK